jgi:hypothetical protein
VARASRHGKFRHSQGIAEIHLPGNARRATAVTRSNSLEAASCFTHSRPTNPVAPITTAEFDTGETIGAPFDGVIT